MGTYEAEEAAGRIRCAFAAAAAFETSVFITAKVFGFAAAAGAAMDALALTGALFAALLGLSMLAKVISGD